MQKLYQLFLEQPFSDLAPETCSKEVLKVRIDDIQKKAHVRSIKLIDYAFINDTHLSVRIIGGKEQIRKFLKSLYEGRELLIADIIENKLMDYKGNTK